MTAIPRPAASTPQDSRIERACRFIDGFGDGVPTLRQIADHVGLSPAWLQKRFTRALGVSPKQYADQRRRERLKSLLREGDEWRVDDVHLIPQPPKPKTRRW